MDLGPRKSEPESSPNDAVRDSSQTTEEEQRPKPDSSPTDATGNTNRLKEDEQRDGTSPVVFTPKKSSQMFDYGFSVFPGERYPSKIRVRPESAPTFGARNANKIKIMGHCYPHLTREKGRAASATGHKRLCEREKLQKSHANVTDRRRAKKQAWTGDTINMDQVANYHNQASRWIEREADYRTQIDNLNAENQQLRSSCKQNKLHATEVKSDLDEEIRGQRDVRAKYENYALESYKSEQQLKKQIRELQKILTEMVNQKENAERDLMKERREREKEYQDAIDVLERDNGRWDSDCVELQRALGKMNKDLQHESKQHEQLSYKYNEVKSDLDEEIREHRDVKAKYENYVFESDKREQQLKKQIRELQKTERDLMKERREQEKEYPEAFDVLKRENGRLESDCVELQQALGKMKKDLQHESKQHEQLSYKYSLLEKQSQAATNTELLQNSDRKKELMDLNHKVEELRKDKDILHTQNQSLCRSLNTKDEKLHHLMDEQRQLLQQVKETDSMKVSDLQRKLTKVNQELAELRADNSALQQDKQLLQNKFDHMEEEMKIDQENKSDEQKMALSQLQREVAALQREKSDLIKKAEQVKSKFQKEEDKLRSKNNEMTMLKADLQHLQNKEFQWLQERKQLVSRNETLSGLLENQRHQNQLHGKKMLELKDGNVRLDRDNKELQNQNQQLMLKCQKTADENVVLKSKTERGSSADRELSSLKQEIKKLQKQQSTVTMERDSLKSDLVDFYRRKEKLSGLLENQRHQNQLHGKKILELKDGNERLDRDNQELQNQNQQLMLKRDSNTQEYQQTSAAAKGKIELLQKEISDLRKRTADSEERVESASKTIHELEWKKRTMEAKIKEQNEQIQESNERLAENQGSVQLGTSNINIRGNKGTFTIHVHDKPSNGENMPPQIDSTESDTDSDCISITEQESENTKAKTKRA